MLRRRRRRRTTTTMTTTTRRRRRPGGEKYVNSDESFCASRDKVESTIEHSRENI